MKGYLHISVTLIILLSAVLTSVFQDEAFAWTGPRAKVVYDDKGAGLLINGQRMPARYIMINLCTVGTPDWVTIKYELEKAKNNGINIVCLCLGYSYNGSNYGHIGSLTRVHSFG